MPSISPEIVLGWIEQGTHWLRTEILIPEYLFQTALMLPLLALSWLLSKRLQPYLEDKLRTLWPSNRLFSNFKTSFLNQLLSLHMMLFLLISSLIYQQLEMEALFINLVLILVTVWFLLQLLSSVILDSFWSRAVSIVAWTVAALVILGVFEPMMQILDGIGFDIGQVHISILTLIKAGFLLIIALRFGSWTTAYIDKQLHHVPLLAPASRVLIHKAVSGLIYFVIALVVLNSIGIDFTALAVFGGALGVGIGFGLQKVVSNLISGFILLSDGSVKPGDVVQIGEVYGWISSLKTRYVSVVTRDGIEYLIPNEDLITQQVINWSYSNTRVRLKVPFGVSYKSDPHQVQALVLSAMHALPRVLKTPPPVCLLQGFGDSSVDMELRVWINDPKNGVANLKSEVLFAVWDTLKENGIEIPFPQRDVHIISQPNPKPTESV